MSLFRTHGSPVATPQFTGLQLQTASSALPIPIIYGITRAAPNLIWSGNFQTYPEYSQSSGKGGGGGQQVSGYTYSTALAFAIGEGPITSIGTVYKGRGLHNPSEFYFSTFTGTTPQAPWGYLGASFPAAALAYQGTAYAASSFFNLGESASIESIAFEVYGRLYPTCVVNAHDADPALVIGDYLTNAQYGVGFPSASLDATSLYGASGDGSYQTYCQAMCLAFSPCLADQETASTTLARWLQLTNATAIWSGGRLKIKPFGDASVTGPLQGGASATFVPNIAPVMDLGDDDFIHDDSNDPLLVARVDPYAAANLLRLEALDRSNQYSATPVEARDQNAIELYGLCVGSTITAHEICDLKIASISAQLILQRGLYVRNSYSFRLSWDYCLLEPMDIVTLTDPGLGLARTPVRIIAIEEDASGLLTITAEEFPGIVATAPTYAVAGATNTPINRNVVPAPVNPPVIFEPPSDLTAGAAQVWLGLSGGTSGAADSNWGGAAIYVSSDNASYAQIGAISAPARQGVLSSAATASTTSLSVSFAESSGVVTLVGTTPVNAYLDGEIVSFSGATLTAPNAYTLTGVRRRLYGMNGGAHAMSAAFLLLDGAVFKYNVPAASIGQPLFLKFASFNIFGAAMQDLSTCVAYPVTPIGSGLFGPVAQEIAVGASMDDGLASAGVGETDSFGLASDPYVEAIDMGLASDGASSLAVAAGGTGATSAIAARTSLGAAAAGANADITSLTLLAGLGINTSADTTTNLLTVKSAASLFDNIGAGVGITINKATSAASAFHLFETGYSGRAQAGLLGTDRYRVAVSTTGSSFTQALDIDPATGHVGLAGYTADANNALGVSGTSFLFNATTDSCRFTFNKVAASNDASLTFETGYSARALLGTTGSDQFQLKVSPDGSSFFQAFVVDQASGNMAIKALLSAASYTVSTLPAGANGALAFASNGCKASETSGSGTGVVVVFSNGQWRRLSDDSIVAS
jgi:hypothetical protein